MRFPACGFSLVLQHLFSLTYLKSHPKIPKKVQRTFPRALHQFLLNNVLCCALLKVSEFSLKYVNAFVFQLFRVPNQKRYVEIMFSNR